PAQLSASLALTLWLMSTYHVQLRNVIGHNESLTSPYHRERYRAWRCQTHGDWRHADMQIYRADLARLARRYGVPLGPPAKPVPPCSSAFWNSSEKTRASAVARLPASDTGSIADSTRLPAASPWTSIARSRSSSSPRSTSSSRRSVSTSCTAAIARMRLTESWSALRGSTPSASRAWSRSSDATVCRLFLTR